MEEDAAAVERVNVIGTGVHAVDMERAVAMIEGWIERRERHYVCVRDVHGVVRNAQDERLRAIHNGAGLVTPDGMPLVWLCRVAGHARVGRVYGPDLMLAACERLMRRSARHFFYGGAPGVADVLAQKLQSRFPGLIVAGVHSPPFAAPNEDDDRRTASMLDAAAPDIVWVGLGTPKQELWMARLRPLVEAPVLIGVGAAFDFHAGFKPQAPGWMRRRGLEWLFRLATEPRRLGPRYAVAIPTFLALLAAQKSGLRRFPLD